MRRSWVQRGGAFLSVLAWVLVACGTGTIGAPGGGTAPVPVPGNHAPTLLTAPSATSARVPEGQQTQLSVTAQDADDDPLRYAWSQVSPATPAGTFSDARSRNPAWTAPTVSGDTPVVLQVVVSDGNGGSVTGTLTLTVAPVSTNRPPVVSEITVTPSAPVAGDRVTLAVTATDPDGDPLTFTWTQTSPATQGTFVTSGAASVVWIAPPIGLDVSFAFTLRVTDGITVPVERLVTVPVKRAHLTDVQPLLFDACQSCHSNLDFTTPAAAYGTLSGNVPSGPCASMPFVVPLSPASSNLVKLVTGTSCGTKMPPGGTFPAGDLVTVESWIASGAGND